MNRKHQNKTDKELDSKIERYENTLSNWGKKSTFTYELSQALQALYDEKCYRELERNGITF